MHEQINRALMERKVNGNAGTSGLPCRVLGKAGDGDWDMSLIEFIRILYLDRIRRADALDNPARDYVISNLLTISGDLEPESYGLFQCGNTERDTGSPQERADERAFYNDGNFWDDLGDLFSWFANCLILAVPAVLALLLLFAAFGAAGALSAAIVVAGLGLVSLHQFRIPETENHLLMINSSRYLTNQLIIDALTDDKEENGSRMIRRRMRSPHGGCPTGYPYQSWC